MVCEKFYLKPGIGHVNKYEAVFGYLVDIWTAATFSSIIFF